MKENVEKNDNKKGKERGRRNELVGIVIGNKMQKTIRVAVHRRVMHPVYKKYIRRTSKYAVHDEKNVAGIGDKVLISETRPTSKTKRWKLEKVIEVSRDQGGVRYDSNAN